MLCLPSAHLISSETGVREGGGVQAGEDAPLHLLSILTIPNKGGLLLPRGMSLGLELSEGPELWETTEHKPGFLLLLLV